MQATDLLGTAKQLLEVDKGARPRQANLRKACSAVYYALFHTLCRVCATALAARTARRAWTQAYRAVDHGITKNKIAKSKEFPKMGFPDAIVDFANLFVQMQEKRHRADYDPNQRFQRSTVKTDIAAAEAVIAALRNVPIKHRRAFATYILLKSRD